MLVQIVHRLLQKLVNEEQLLLAEGASVIQIANDIVKEMPRASFASHFGPWISTQLLAHPLVDELFASDRELTNALKDMGA
jgi:hypothetical protein